MIEMILAVEVSEKNHYRPQSKPSSPTLRFFLSLESFSQYCPTVLDSTKSTYRRKYISGSALRRFRKHMRCKVKPVSTFYLKLSTLVLQYTCIFRHDGDS